MNPLNYIYFGVFWSISTYIGISRVAIDMILFILYMWQKEINKKKIGRLSMTDKKNNVSNKSK